MKFDCRRTEKGWEAIGSENGNVCVIVRLVECDGSLYLHNIVNRWTPRVFKIYRRAFNLLKKGAFLVGYKFIVVCDKVDEDLPKKEKYWRLMGFNIFTQITVNGDVMKCAGMELSNGS